MEDFENQQQPKLEPSELVKESGETIQRVTFRRRRPETVAKSL